LRRIDPDGLRGDQHRTCYRYVARRTPRTRRSQTGASPEGQPPQLGLWVVSA
jgi:hypothetical protein